MPRIRESAQRAPTERADPCHKAPFRASAAGGRKASKTASSGGPRGLFQSDQLRPDPVPYLFGERLRRLGRADHDLEFDHFAGLAPLRRPLPKAARAFNSAGTSLIGLFSPGILKDFVKNSTRNSANDFESSNRRVHDAG
jgi:hypothetical protein